jgi:hypothetical protein
MVTVDVTTFANEDGTACDMNGWTLVTGANCRTDAGGCTSGGDARECATTNICVNINGNWLMRSDQAQNGSNREEWRIQKTFDLSNLANNEVCFYFAGAGLLGNDALLVYASDSQNDDLIFCQNGMVRTGANNVAFPLCASLPAWTDDNPAVTITILAHSEDNNHILYLDNVIVHGWPSQCAANAQDVLSEDFDGCPGTPLPNPWNGWTVDGTLYCNSATVCEAGGRAIMSNGFARISRVLDASNLDGNVRLCFWPGEIGVIDSLDGMLVEFSIDGGSNWAIAWGFSNNFGPASPMCGEICVNLSDIDRRVNRNGSLGLRFSFFSDNTNHYVMLDHILLSGATYCDGTTAIEIGPFAEIGMAGEYSFTVTNQPKQQLYTDLQCRWDALSTPAGQSSIYFIP